MPSVTIASTIPEGFVRRRIVKVQTSTASRATMIGSLAHRNPNCTDRIHAALSSSDRIAGTASVACRASSDVRKSCRTA